MSLRNLISRWSSRYPPIRTLATWRFPLVLAAISQLLRYAYLEMMLDRYLAEEGATAQEIAAEDAFIFRYRVLSLIVILIAGIVCARFATRKEMLVSALIISSAYLIADIWGVVSPFTFPKAMDDFISYCYQWYMIPYYMLRDLGLPRTLAIFLMDTLSPLIFVPFARRKLPEEEEVILP